MNKTIITGALGNDATINQERKVINFSLAVNTGYKENKKTIWFSCAKFGDKYAIAEYLKKGIKVLVEGEIDLKEYTTKDGEKKSQLTLYVSNIELLGGNQEKQSEAKQNQPQQPVSTEPVDDLPF